MTKKPKKRNPNIGTIARGSDKRYSPRTRKGNKEIENYRKYGKPISERSQKLILSNPSKSDEVHRQKQYIKRNFKK